MLRFRFACLAVILLAGCPTLAHGQCASVYTSMAPDGAGHMHAITTIVDNNTNSNSTCKPAGWGTNFQHTYKTSMTIKSPSGRTSSNNYTAYAYAGTGTATVRTDDFLDLDGETGTFMLSGLDTITCSVAGLFFSNVLNVPFLQIAVSQSPVNLSLSTGDVAKTITTTVSPSSLSITPVFTSVLQRNPNSTCAVSTSFSASTGTGSVGTTVTASPPGCSGLFSAIAMAAGVASSSSTVITVPPQILVRMLYGEAHGQAVIGDNISQRAIGVATRNRFSQQSFFGGVTTYQAAITPQQFMGISNITNGPLPDLDNAAAVFASLDGAGVANSACFFSPTHLNWLDIQMALQSGTKTLPTVAVDPQCYGVNRQFVVKQSVGNNADGRGAPAFIFEQQRNPASDAAVVQIP